MDLEMEVRFSKLQRKFNLLCLWLQLKFRNDRSFPQSILQDSLKVECDETEYEFENSEEYPSSSNAFGMGITQPIISPDEDLIVGDESGYVCLICDKRLPTFQTLTLHQSTHCFVNLERLTSAPFEGRVERPASTTYTEESEPGSTVCPDANGDVPKEEDSHRAKNSNRKSGNRIIKDVSNMKAKREACGTECGTKRTCRDHIEKVHRQVYEALIAEGKLKKSEQSEPNRGFKMPAIANTGTPLAEPFSNQSVPIPGDGNSAKPELLTPHRNGKEVSSEPNNENKLKEDTLHTSDPDFEVNPTRKKSAKNKKRQQDIKPPKKREKKERPSPDSDFLVRCEECSKIIHQSYLPIHIKTHRAPKSFLCSECGYATKRKSSLQTHMMTHASDYPFKCTLCSYSAKTAGALCNHRRRVHTVTTFSPCPYCGEMFKRNEFLMVHIKSVHDNLRPFPCSLCEKAFKSKTHLKYHLSTHQNPNSRKRGLNKEREPIRRAQSKVKKPIIEQFSACNVESSLTVDGAPAYGGVVP